MTLWKASIKVFRALLATHRAELDNWSTECFGGQSGKVKRPSEPASSVPLAGPAQAQVVPAPSAGTNREEAAEQPQAKRHAADGEGWWRSLDQRTFDIVQLLGVASQGWHSGGGNATERFGKVTMSASPPSGRTFYQSEHYFVKVHDFSVCDVSSNDHWGRAGTAFLEASATSYVCAKESWWCRTFGVLCGSGGNEHAYVFIVRRRLEQTTGDRVAAAVSVLIKIALEWHVLHNDGHMFNVMMFGSGLEAVDFERASRFVVTGDRVEVHEAHWQLNLLLDMYCRRVCNPGVVSCPKIISLMTEHVRVCGLGETHKHFALMYRSGEFRRTAFDEHAFGASPVTTWRYCAWLHLMTLLPRTDLDVRWDEHRGSGPAAAFSISFRLRGNCSRVRFVTESTTVRVITCENISENGDIRQLNIDKFEALTAHSNPWLLTDSNVTRHFVTQALQYFRDDAGYLRSDPGDSDSDDASGGRAAETGAGRRRPPPSGGSGGRGRAASDCNAGGTSDSGQTAPSVHWIMRSTRNVNVLGTILSSMRIRYLLDSPSTQDLTRYLERMSRSGGRPSEPLPTALRARHFGCHSVVVDAYNKRKDCLKYIREHDTLSLDTEQPCPRHTAERECALIQIGTTEVVYLIQVHVQYGTDFLSELGRALAGKTLVFFGGDDADALRRVLPAQRDGRDTFLDKDIHRTHFPAAGNSLAACIGRMMRGRHILDKTWTNSGWDVTPLRQEQIEYATLDVVCCHALYMGAVEHRSLQFDERHKVYRIV